MEKMTQFNIRVYGILIVDNKLLLIKDKYAGETLIKFPGGGLEFGEGIVECLQREFIEELNLSIEIKKHFYTQEQFLLSKFNMNEQLVTIYYKVKTQFIERITILEKDIEDILWIPLLKLNSEIVTLPIDKIVIDKLIK